MNKKNRKGFTIVELVIVIAVIGILTAILIPTFMGITDKAHQTENETFVRNINTQLAINEASSGKKNPTMYEAVKDAQDMGFDVEKITPYNGNDIIWDSVNDRFAIVKADYATVTNKKDSVVYADGSFDVTTDLHKLWKIYPDMPGSQTYAIYAKNTWTIPTEIDNLKVGFDSGTVSKIKSITYTGNIDAVIRTNGGTLTVDAPSGSVSHYGFATTVDVDDVAVGTFRAYGKIGRLKYSDMNGGKIRFEDGSVTYCYMNKSDDPAADAGSATKIGTAEVYTSVPSSGEESVYGGKAVTVTDKEVSVAACHNHNVEFDVIDIFGEKYMVCRCCGAYSKYTQDSEDPVDASPELKDESGNIKDDILPGPYTKYGFANSYEVPEKTVGAITTPAHWVHEIETAKQFENLATHLAPIDAILKKAESDRTQKEIKSLDDALKSEYLLTKDIDMTGITNSILVGTTFYGTLNGNDKAIKNYTFTDPEKSGAGLIGKFYNNAVVKDLTLENVKVTGNESCGLLFGTSYCHSSSPTKTGTVFTAENVTVDSTCLLNGIKGLGVIAGSTRYIETIKATGCINYADVIANGYNVGGLFGTMSGNKTITLNSCENHGNIRATSNVGGLLGQLPGVENLTIINCKNYGKVTAFSYDSNNKVTCAGWFAGFKQNANPTFTYSGNYNEGKILYTSDYADKWAVGGAFEASLEGISMKDNLLPSSFIAIDDTIVLSVDIDEQNNWIVNGGENVDGASYYTVAMQVWARDVRLSGSTVTVFKEHYLPYMKRFNTVAELKEGFGHITRAGYVLNSVYTNYDVDSSGGLSNTSIQNGAANFFRLPYANRNQFALNQVAFDSELNEWVFVTDAQAGCAEGMGIIFSPKNTTVSYTIAAFDENDHVIAAYTKYEKGVGSYTTCLKNMNGDLCVAPQDWSQPWPDVA